MAIDRRTRMGASQSLLGCVLAICLVYLGCVGVAPAFGADSLVAHNAAEIPPEWTALAPAGSCMNNPWKVGCPQPTSVTYPPRAQLRQILNARLGAGVTASLPPVKSAPAADGQAATLTAVVGPSEPGAVAARAATSVGACTLTVFAPSIISVGGNYIAHGTSTVQCPEGYSYGEVSSDLWRDVEFLDTDTSGDIFPPIFAAATASYDCDHTRTLLYQNTGLGYVETYAGGAAANSATVYAAHTCPG